MLTDRQTDKTDRHNSNMTWIAIGLGEVRRKDERSTPAVPLWSRQWTSRCRRPRKLFYIDFLPNFSRHDLPSASRRRKMLPCTKEEVEALFYFIYNLYLTLYPIRTLSIPFPNFTAVHGVGVAQAKPACKHTIATRKCYQYNTCFIMTISILLWSHEVLLLQLFTVVMISSWRTGLKTNCIHSF